MTLKAAQCPSCGGELQLPEDKNKVTCMHCDTSIVLGIMDTMKDKTEPFRITIEQYDTKVLQVDVHLTYTEVFEMVCDAVRAGRDRGPAAELQNEDK